MACRTPDMTERAAERSHVWHRKREQNALAVVDAYEAPLEQLSHQSRGGEERTLAFKTDIVL